MPRLARTSPVRFWTFYMIGDYPWPAFANSNAPSAPATYDFALGYNATSPPPSGSALPAGATVRTACQCHHDRQEPHWSTCRLTSYIPEVGICEDRRAAPLKGLVGSARRSSSSPTGANCARSHSRSPRGRLALLPLTRLSRLALPARFRPYRPP
jgi:hypothetical protein